MDLEDIRLNVNQYKSHHQRLYETLLANTYLHRTSLSKTNSHTS